MSRFSMDSTKIRFHIKRINSQSPPTEKNDSSLKVNIHIDIEEEGLEKVKYDSLKNHSYEQITPSSKNPRTSIGLEQGPLGLCKASCSLVEEDFAVEDDANLAGGIENQAVMLALEDKLALMSIDGASLMNLPGESHYGYAYILKHKHEVFETFKVFKNEVENQLEKTIKALRSDRGGEYISQEFKDYLKACGIVQQLTPPYTPQHNGVSERRNQSATRILNMVPTKKVDKTPYELWYEKVPNLSYLKVWGCEALVKRDTPEKLQQRFVKCIFIGYPKETMEVSGRVMDLEEIQDEDTSPSEITSEIPIEVEGFKPPQEEEIPIRRGSYEPTSYKAAILDFESNKWIDAMNAEIQSIMDNMLWILIDLPPGCKTVGSKWIFKKKTDMDGIVHTYKARLVAKGYTQLYGVDYEETFSPVADIRAIRILISIAAFYDYEIWQMDVKTAFLNGYLDEDIYMVQPEGFVDPNHPRKVCKLQRSIYGLKQASRSWNKRFDEEIKRFGFDQNLDEPCVYQKASGSNVTFLILYVDDIIIMGFGEAAFILGIQTYRDRSKQLIGLVQNAYMDKILKRYRMDNSKCGHIPMQERLDLNKTQLQHLKSRFQQNPGESHWAAVKIFLKYLRNTKDMFLVYGGNLEAELRVDCYCNAGFETDIDDMKSLAIYVLF
ncbi:retrotransposon protein, putative, ty1-copia subclass [Tanacetum coccineum]